MGYVAGTLYRSPMAKFLSWTIYFYDFESYLFDRELFYEKVFFLSGLMYNQLGESRAKALLFFHALTGSDTTSAFRNKGKKNAWNTW